MPPTSSQSKKDDDDTPNIEAPKKRQRVSRACDSCRKKKIKCDGVRPTCNNCRNGTAQCIYTVTEKKIGVTRRRATNIVKLESRLDRIETMLEALIPVAGKNKRGRKIKQNEISEDSDDNDDEDEEENQEGHDEDEDEDDEDVQDEVDEGSSSDANINQDENYTPDEWALQDVDVPEGSVMINFQPKLKITRKSDMFARSMARGTSLFCGPGPNFALLSSSGLKWIGEKIDDDKIADKLAVPFMDILSDQMEKIRPLVEPMAKAYTINKQILDACFELFLHGPNLWKFIITPEEVDEIIRAEYYDESLPPNGYSEHFVLNAIIAIALPVAYRRPDLRAKMPTLSSDKLMEMTASNYYSNCLYYARRVTLIHPNITSVKALLLLMVALECSNSPHPIAYIIKVAAHLASEMGLNRKESCNGLSKDEANRRKALFWLVYVFDHDVAMKVCRSAAIMDCDITIDLPDFDKDDDRYPDGQFLRLLVSFFHLSSDCYVRLFSPKAQTKRPIDIVKDVQYCDEQLEKWKKSVPSEYMPGCNLDYFAITDPAHETMNKEFHMKGGVLYMHYLYYQLLSSIHRTVAYHPSWIYLLIEEEKATALKPSKGSKSNCSSNHSTPNSKPGSASSPNGGLPNSAPSNSNTNSNSESNAKSSFKNELLSIDQSPLIALHYKYPRLFSSLDICNHAAWRTVELIQRTKTWTQLFLWASIYFATNSIIALFVKCLAKPFDPTTRLDLDILKTIPDAFRGVSHAASGSDRVVPMIINFWTLLYDIAQSFVEKAHANNPSNSYSSPSSTTSDQHAPKRMKIKREKSNTSSKSDSSGIYSRTRNVTNVQLSKSSSFPISHTGDTSVNIHLTDPSHVAPLSSVLQPASDGLLPTEGSIYVPLAQRMNIGFGDSQQSLNLGSSSYGVPPLDHNTHPATLPNGLPPNSMPQQPHHLSGGQSQQTSYLPMPIPDLDNVDYIPDPNMIQSLFHISSYPFSWDSDFAVFSGFSQSP